MSSWTQADGSPWPEFASPVTPPPPCRAQLDGVICRICATELRYDGDRLLPCESDVCKELRAERELGRKARCSPGEAA